MDPHLSATSRGPFLDQRSLRRYLDERSTEIIEREGERIGALDSWVSSLGALKKKSNEQALEQSFNSIILCDVLGYTLHPNEGASAFPKPPTSITGIGRTPDLIIGSAFGDDDQKIMGVIELKKPGTPYDVPQARENSETPVEQAFAYARSLIGVRWIIVSDMMTLRLYSIESETEFLDFDLRRAAETRLNRDEFRRLFFLLGHDFLAKGGEASPLSLLFQRTATTQLGLQASFYKVYHQIRSDLFRAIQDSVVEKGIPATREDCLQATQRLLDRLIFIYYCEDAPSNLLQREVIKRVVDAARMLPGANPGKVYDALKSLFAEVDSGSSETNTLKIPGYNGELFKPHPIIDAVTLPDKLHDKRYEVELPGGTKRRISGVWGLHEFDFWQELNEHLLGRIFEESLSDFVAIEAGEEPDPAARVRERRRHGVYYTTEHLADFLARSAIGAHLAENAPLRRTTTKDALASELETRLDTIGSMRIGDLACGSGAFLVGSYHALLLEAWRCQNGVNSIRKIEADLFTAQAGAQRKALLRECIFGADLVPQAVEIAKLALWIRSAYRGEKVATLDRNIFTCDSLAVSTHPADLRALIGQLDLIVGNPPWGGEVLASSRNDIVAALGLDDSVAWDSWELFLAFTIHSLKEGGRLALVLPDTLLSPEKARTRKILLETTSIELLHALGPDWFGAGVRMGAVVVQARKGAPSPGNIFRSLLLHGELRRRAIRGELPLEQLQARFGRDIPQDRCRASEDASIEVFRSVQDDEILGRIEEHSVTLDSLCERGRGEELSKSGLLWRCPGCGRHTTPGRAKRGGGFEDKHCPHCELTLSQDSISERYLVAEGGPGASGNTAPFIDGDDISRRYIRVVPSKAIDLGCDDFSYKAAALYASPKLLIRQAGVGVTATLDESSSLCPQSVYVHRLRHVAVEQGYSHEFVLAALLSRTMAYVVFKKFAEVDAARAFAKVTLTRLQRLPIPRLDPEDGKAKRLHDRITASVKDLLDGRAVIGSKVDLEIEQGLRELWGLTPEDGAAINMELASLPVSRALEELAPLPIQRVAIEE